uniref:F-box/LRR-repeat/kelch-repeat protein n=1 Tax=Noccaea caerulescens TaxID=107243 RepID=A0A1J3F2T9_NOCCA
MWKKRGLIMESRMESLPHHVVEHIMERLPAKSLLRFKAVSKQWSSTIESPVFHERQLKHGQQSGDPHVLMVSVLTERKTVVETIRRLVLGSSTSIKIPTPWEKENTIYLVSSSCDGLVYLYLPDEPGFMVNPTTRWYRPIPLCKFHQLVIDLGESYYELRHGLFKVGFGKDVLTGTYKLVYVYNSSEIGLENATICEVFDFSTNAWRYVTPSAPYRIVGCPDPVFVDGSLHWFTDCEETKVVSFNLHTEAFQVMAKTPFANAHPRDIVMCNLDNRLCISGFVLPDKQVIWSFNSGNNTWDKVYSIDVYSTSVFFNIPSDFALSPLTLLDVKKKKKKKLLFHDRADNQTLLAHDPETGSAHIVFSTEPSTTIGYPVYYFESLISI